MKELAAVRCKSRPHPIGGGANRWREKTFKTHDDGKVLMAKVARKVAVEKAPKAASPAIKPVKQTLTKSALINLIAEENEIPRKTAAGVYATLENLSSAPSIRVASANSSCPAFSRSACARSPRDGPARSFATRRPAKWSRPVPNPPASA